MAREKSQVVLTYRMEEVVDVLGVFDTEEEAWDAAVQHLEDMNVDMEELHDLGLTLKEAAQRWGDVTEGYEDFSLEQVRKRGGKRS